MWIVKKHQPEVKIATLDMLERDALLEGYDRQEHGCEPDTLAYGLVKRARDAGAWFLCDCRQDAPAYIFPRRLSNGTLCLVRPNPDKQIPHADTCPFHLSPEERRQVETSSLPPSEDNFYLLKSPKNQENTDRRKERTSDVRHIDSADSPLKKRLIYLLEGAGLTQINGYLDNKLAFMRLRQWLRQRRLWRDAPFTLLDLSVFHLSQQYALFERLREMDFGERRKQGFILTLVDRLEGQQIGQGRVMIDVKHSLAVSSSDMPCWALFLVGEAKPGSGYFEARDVAFIPAYSATYPVPVREAKDREILKDLLSFRIYCEDKDKTVRINIPLGDAGHVTVTANDRHAVITTGDSEEQDRDILRHNTKDFKKMLSRWLFADTAKPSSR